MSERKTPPRRVGLVQRVLNGQAMPQTLDKGEEGQSAEPGSPFAGLTRRAPRPFLGMQGQSGKGEQVQELPLGDIELDPDNPRHLNLDPQEPGRINPNDSHHEEKRARLERLREMAQSVRSEGVIQPIIVYPHAKKYRILYGERRYLASVLAGKPTIPAIVRTKPEGDLRLRQFIENVQREDLPLKERLENIEAIIAEKGALNEAVDTAEALANLTGLGMTQASLYLRVVRGPEDVREAVCKRTVASLDKAGEIAGCSQPGRRKAALSACARGASLKQLRDLLVVTQANPEKDAKRGRPRAGIKLGVAKNVGFVQQIMEAVGPETLLEGVDWEDLVTVEKVWVRFRKYHGGDV